MQQRREWRRLGAWTAVAVAIAAAGALAATVAVAASGFAASSNALVRGEGEAIVRGIERRIGAETFLPENAEIARIQAFYAADGLRYVALVEDDGRLVSSAGTPAMSPSSDDRPGEMREDATRVRLVETLPPPRNAPPPRAREGEHDRPRPPRLIVEIEPPLRAQLAGAMRRTVATGGAAVALLLVGATVLARRAATQEALEKKAETERRLAALGRMSAVVAHELRNPLASLKGHAQLLAESLEAGSPQHVKAERVVGDAERIERLTEDLLTIVREGPIDRRWVATDAFVDELRAAVPTVRLVVTRDHAPARLSIDPPRILVALTNLVRNAVQASTEGSRATGAPNAPSGMGAIDVEVHVASRGSHVVVEVRDRGCGLPEGEETRIFEPFVTHRTRGTGLGLTVARRAVEQHDGTLTGENRAGGGAVFRVVIPS